MKDTINDMLRGICRIYFFTLIMLDSMSIFFAFACGAGAELLKNVFIIALFISYVYAFRIISKHKYDDKKYELILFIISILLITLSLIFIAIDFQKHNTVSISNDTTISTLLFGTIPGILLLSSVSWSYLFCRNIK